MTKITLNNQNVMPHSAHVPESVTDLASSGRKLFGQNIASHQQITLRFSMLQKKKEKKAHASLQPTKPLHKVQNDGSLGPQQQPAEGRNYRRNNRDLAMHGPSQTGGP